MLSKVLHPRSGSSRRTAQEMPARPGSGYGYSSGYGGGYGGDRYGTTATTRRSLSAGAPMTRTRGEYTGPDNDYDSRGITSRGPMYSTSRRARSLSRSSSSSSSVSSSDYDNKIGRRHRRATYISPGGQDVVQRVPIHGMYPGRGIDRFIPPQARLHPDFGTESHRRAFLDTEYERYVRSHGRGGGYGGEPIGRYGDRGFSRGIGDRGYWRGDNFSGYPGGEFSGRDIYGTSRRHRHHHEEMYRGAPPPGFFTDRRGYEPAFADPNDPRAHTYRKYGGGIDDRRFASDYPISGGTGDYDRDWTMSRGTGAGGGIGGPGMYRTSRKTRGASSLSSSSSSSSDNERTRVPIAAGGTGRRHRHRHGGRRADKYPASSGMF